MKEYKFVEVPLGEFADLSLGNPEDEVNELAEQGYRYVDSIVYRGTTQYLILARETDD